MKRLALVAAVLALAACTAKKDDAATIDTSAPAMAPAPAAMDSAMVRDSIVRDSVRKDSIAKAAAKKK
jgi:uncharacterized lipoprotein YajG